MIRAKTHTTLLQQAQAWLASQPRSPRRTRLAGQGTGSADSLETALMCHFRDSGDRVAFEWLYRLSSDALARWVATRGAVSQSSLDVDEVVQDTFINVYRYHRSFQGHGPHGFRRWARTIAANAMSRSKRRRALPLVEWKDGDQDVADSQDDPCVLMQQQEQGQALQDAYLLLLQWVPLACARLSPRDRYVLTALHGHGASHREVEEELELKPGGLKMIVHRARTRLRGYLIQIGLAAHQRPSSVG
ncbi:MAG: RNA polymerase sigma factor [Planctomycetes bacterium]|nr:RNA polymerase sigma factor [Planctomycetota bacterium]MCB9908833.1 RNA polymerase sigma factor [Planctomycetota bacterium]